MILIDIFSSYNTVFFLNVLNSKNIYKIILYGLIIDFIIAFSHGFITVFLIIGYLISKYIKNYYVFNILIFILFSLIFFKTVLLDSFLLQVIFIVLNKNHIINWWKYGRETIKAVFK